MTVRLRKTSKFAGVESFVVVSFTLKVKGPGGAARYGFTVPFASSIVSEDRKNGSLRRFTSGWARSAWVDIAAATRIAIANTGIAFTANRRSFRSPNQYGTMKVVIGM